MSTASGAKLLPAVGFLTLVDDAETGVCGGYLILNAAGRPLEFHCTAPIKANRAQEILYGATLKPYLYGEQIGQALVAKSPLKPLWLCTDAEPALAVREFLEMPVALIGSAAGEAEQAVASAKVYRRDGAHPVPAAPHASGLVSFTVAGYTLAVHGAHAEDRAAIVERWTPHAERLDLTEPFTRIREALAEAQRGAK